MKLFYYYQFHIWRIIYWEHLTSLAWIPSLKKSVPEDNVAEDAREVMLPKEGESNENHDIEMQPVQN